MKLNSDESKLAESKILILYVLNKINKPITNTDLLRTITPAQDINYFYFQQFLLDLIENKYITSYEKDTFILYELTPLGRNALSITQDSIPGIMKFKIDNSMKDNLEKIENESSIIAEYVPKSENEYIVKLKIIENNNVLFELQTFAGSRETAKKITENWQTNANSLYPEILNLLVK